ncbi:MAG TPA: BTAD domain-containing putative transcriptional regulator [Amycolatopsis sp.]|uniref:AfsR/SARP family transcriptional regulator n=1 Tax=Amycolatopsis sp. TaxID=37632 RepID=UPI002B483459|nr:BTAD domain-containing putative transcriptional regulator [Amycolatopsis sp.]HKS44750.1 BTAD domain-containing putative transcriptional regulator [Amycolatopsis sp.]
MTKFGVLGPLTVESRGEYLRLRGDRQRSLLAMLLFKANQRVPVPQLVDALWTDLPPKSYASNLHTYVSRLRERLDGARIDHAQDGYRLQIEPGDLDLLVFRAEAEAGRHAAQAGEHARAAKHFRRALAQWRGQPLTDLHLPQLVSEASLLEAERLLVHEECVDTELAGGRHAELVGELRAILVEHPLQEHTAAQLMTALHRCGRQAEALEVYRRTRTALIEEVGVEPGAELRRAHAAVLGGEDPAPRAAARLPWPLCQLPPPLTDFSGRAAELTALTNATPVTVISGEPGAGKTALAVQVAHRMSVAFPDGQLFIPLNGTAAPRDIGAVLTDLLRALGVSGPMVPEDPYARAAAYRGMLTGRRVLVVLDDAADAAQTRPLLPGTPGCAVLVTSRRKLTGLEGARRLQLGPLSDRDAQQLLGRIAGAERVRDQAPAAERIAAACGNLPLALRIAGTRLAIRPNLGLAALAGRLEDKVRRLDELTTSDLQVRGSIALSYQALSPRAQVALRAISRCRNAGQPAWAVTALINHPAADGLIEELVESSLLQPIGVDRTGEPRFRLHDMVRLYAAELGATMDSGADRIASVRGLVDAAIGLADAAARKLSPGELAPAELPPQPLPAGLVARLTANPEAWFAAERANLMTAIGSVCALGWHSEAALLVDRLAVYLRLHEHHADLRACHDILASHAQATRAS